jgi:adenylyltransferase/sulfurtransferase
MVREVTVHELQAMRASASAPVVLDVREAWELDVARLPDVVHIPMNEIPERLSELNPATETIVMCRSGGRSMRVAQYLASQGFGRVANLEGGILAWGAEIDRNVPQY